MLRLPAVVMTGKMRRTKYYSLINIFQAPETSDCLVRPDQFHSGVEQSEHLAILLQTTATAFKILIFCLLGSSLR